MSKMNLLDRTWPTPAENLACDEALLHYVDEQPVCGWLRLWESPQRAVILGRSNRVRDDVCVEACRRDGVPILRRCSGGGAVLLGPGCLAFTLVLPVTAEHHLHGIPAATAAILQRVVAALQPCIAGVEMCGTSDLAVAGRKFSGNSQRWLRSAMLHHGTLLYDFDIESVSRYLHIPQRQPDYRATRDHREFLMNVPVDRRTLAGRLIAAWEAQSAQTDPPDRTIADLVRTRYAADAWNLRL